MRSHNLSVSFAMCRICHSGEQSMAYDKSTVGEPLISPCYCKGTMGLYHRSCLERWLASSNTNACEICHFTYQTGRRYRTFCEFIGSKKCYVERRNLVTDVTCFIFLTPIVVGCIVLCLSSSVTQTRGFQLWNNISGCQAISLLVLSVMLSITYTIWLIVTIAFHIKTYLDWRILNEMRLLCADLRSFLHDLCRIDLGSSNSAANANPGANTGAVRESRTSTLSSGTSDINYNEFVRHLQPEEVGVCATSSSRYIVSSTPLPSATPTHVPIFDYPTVDSRISELSGTQCSSTNDDSKNSSCGSCKVPIE